MPNKEMLMLPDLLHGMQAAIMPRFRRKVRPESSAAASEACTAALMACACLEAARSLLRSRSMLQARPPFHSFPAYHRLLSI